VSTRSLQDLRQDHVGRLWPARRRRTRHGAGRQLVPRTWRLRAHGPARPAPRSL